MLVAVFDVVTDALFVNEVKCKGYATFFDASLGFLLASVALNTVLAVYAFVKFKKRSEYRGTYGVVTVLSCTSSELLALLPWEGGDDGAGFPAADDTGLFTVKRMHFALVTFEDAPAAVIQIFYVALHSDDTSAATWLSLVATCVAAMWRLFVKADDVCRVGWRDADPASSTATSATPTRGTSTDGRTVELSRTRSGTAIVKYSDGEELRL